MDVTGVIVSGDFRLHLTFADGSSGDVDFSNRQWLGVFADLKDPNYFAKASVDANLGTIVWPNGADMAPETLYRMVAEGRLSV